MGKNKEKKVKLSKEEKKALKMEKREQKGTFGERMSLRFRKNVIASNTRTILIVLVLVLLFISINLLARESDFQFDFTEGKLYTLTDISKEQIENIDKDVTIYVYGFEDTSSEVNLLKQYSDVNSHINYEIITTEDNLQMIEDYDLDDYGTAFIVKCGDRDNLIYAGNFYEFNYSTYSYGDVPVYEENYVTNAIINVSADDIIGVYFVTGHGEKGIDDCYYVTTDLEDKVYSCYDFSLLTEEIPDDCGVLVFANPTVDISAEEANKVKNYINNGGDMIVTWYKNSPDTNFTNFQSVLDLYGVSVEYGLLYEDGTNSYYGEKYYIIPTLSSYSNVTSDLVSVGYTSWLYSYTQRIKNEDISDDNISVETEEIIYTSDSCYNITNQNDIIQGISVENAEQDSWTVGEKVTRTVGEEDSDDSVTSNLIIYSNAEFYLDESMENTYHYNPGSSIANETIFVSSVEDLTDQEDLIEIIKGSSDSTEFTVTVTTMMDLVVRVIIFVIPMIIILIGIIIWVRRRRKR